MSPSKASSPFLGRYSDRDVLLRVARWADVVSWAVVIVYVLDLLLSAGVFGLQIARGFRAGMGPSDLTTNILLIIERPFRGFVYFVALQAIAKALLILMDTEVGLRRVARP